MEHQQEAAKEINDAAKPSSIGSWQNRYSQQNLQQQADSHSGSHELTPKEKLSSANDQTGIVSPSVKPSLINSLLQNNKRWSARMNETVPGFFSTLAKQQTPDILWIGCSDSRVPANQIIDLPPGEVFVHRNIANVFVHTDLNALSVLQYAVDVLRVKYVIVCGHYGCGGVAASIDHKQFGLIDNWLRNIKDVYESNQKHISDHVNDVNDPNEKIKLVRNRLTELNVQRSVRNICATTVLQNAWLRGQNIEVHGWCYRLSDGVITDLDIMVNSLKQVPEAFKMTE